MTAIQSGRSERIVQRSGRVTSHRTSAARRCPVGVQVEQAQPAVVAEHNLERRFDDARDETAPLVVRRDRLHEIVGKGDEHVDAVAAAVMVDRAALAVDRAAAQAMLNEYVRRVERQKVGLIEATDEHRKKAIAQHVTDYEKYLRAKANAPRYIALAIGRLKALLAGCKFKTIGQITASGVANWLRHQRDANAFGKATSNDYLVAAKAFCNWLVRERRFGHNPLTHLQRLNTETDVRRKRRVLTAEELELLIAAAEKSEGRLGRMRGADRAIVYRLAAFTGLRAQEIASLTPRSFALDADPPTVTVDACYSKHRRKDVLPLADDLCRRLRTYLAQREEAHRGGDERLWPGKWYRKAGEILQRDLAAAREAWVKDASGAERKRREASDFLRDIDAAGQVVDFHSLRHGFITNLVMANVPPKVAQALARHSTITLTMDRYTHLGMGDLVEAVGRLVQKPTGDR